MNRICRICSLEEDVFLDGYRGTGRAKHPVIRSIKTKRRWDGYSCPKCRAEKTVKMSRLRGVRPIDMVTHARAVKGRAAEKSVADFYQQAGFSVELGNGQGPDLIVNMGTGTIRVEVKSVSKSRNSNSWFVAPVSPKRRQDDVVALVFPEGEIHIISMREHLLACSAGGSRTVTDLCRKIRGNNRKPPGKNCRIGR